MFALVGWPNLYDIKKGRGPLYLHLTDVQSEVADRDCEFQQITCHYLRLITF